MDPRGFAAGNLLAVAPGLGGDRSSQSESFFNDTATTEIYTIAYTL
eukprot:COSAG02_NODE_54838_length_294_cov_0.415385_1_plen_45_part_10